MIIFLALLPACVIFVFYRYWKTHHFAFGSPLVWLVCFAVVRNQTSVDYWIEDAHFKSRIGIYQKIVDGISADEKDRMRTENLTTGERQSIPATGPWNSVDAKVDSGGTLLVYFHEPRGIPSYLYCSSDKPGPENLGTVHQVRKNWYALED